MKQRIWKKMINSLLVVILIISLVPVVPMKQVEASTMTDAQIQEKINNLNSLLGGKYFTIGQTASCGDSGGHGCENCRLSNIIRQQWFKDLFGTVSINQFPATHTSNCTGSIDGYSCYGFGAFAEWYIFANSSSDKITTNHMGTYSFNYSNMISNAKIGDLIRLESAAGTGGHSVIFIGAYQNYITVLDCNWGTKNAGIPNCKVSMHNVYYSSYALATINRAGNSGAIGSGASTSTDASNPGSPYPIPAANLRYGSTGDAVRWVQKFANDVLGAGITVDGIFGNQTLTAVKQFQQNNGLTVDGIVGTQTTATMLSVWQNKVSASKPVDLGDEFAAIILRTDIWKSIKNMGNNVVLWDEEANAQYHWLFKKQSDGSYMIQSLYDGNMLDVYGAYTENGTNIQVYHQHGEDNGAQKYYIYGSGNSYKIVPKIAPNSCLDVAGAATENGTNIQLYESNGSIAQQFSIYKITHSNLNKINIASDLNKTMYVGEKQTVKYTLSPSETRSNMVTWTSYNTDVLSIDSNGVVTAKKAGNALIRCTSTYDANIYVSVTITVEEKKVVTTESVTEARTEAPTTEARTEAPTTEMRTTEARTEAPTTEERTTEARIEATIEERTTEVRTEALTTEEKTTEVRTETSTTEEQTTEVSTEFPTTGESIDKETGTGETSLDNSINEPSVQEEEQKEEQKGSEIEEEDIWNCEPENEYEDEDEVLSPAEVGTILSVSNKKCKVIVTCDAVDNPTVDYLKSTNKKAKKVTIPAKVTIDGITYAVTGIADDAFCDNKKITHVTISDTVTHIGESSFENCKKLKSITIPKTVKNIGRNAFRDCKSLKKITIKSTVLSNVGKNAFKNIGKKVTISIPKSKVKDYKKMLKKAGVKMK